MSGPSSVVSDPAYIRARAMETLFERLEHLCEGAIAIDRSGRVVYVNEKYVTAMGLSHESEGARPPDRGGHPQQPDAQGRGNG
ncbi:hypothetical protein [Bradyrhizobium diazoefficiens]|uniref:hypothetical protein n=1 Tax=Bradyrhizobium diazoefficiens TaxID=1355477 RepID=UPI00351772E0